MSRFGARAAVVIVVGLVGSLAGFVNPAWACGCGAMVSNSALRVDGEASIVRWDGRTEQIVMRLAVDSQATDAAWIFPTPTVATVKLGDPTWFKQIDALTTPQIKVKRDWWPGIGVGLGSSGGDRGPAGGPPPGSVKVLGEQRLGALVVATLDATDAGALSAWLGTNGYRLRPELAQALEVYVKARWKFVAVKLAPEATNAALRGDLDPLALSFNSDRLIYPMYLSHLAKSAQYVHVWVLAPHRVQRTDPDASRIATKVRFAGPATGLTGSLGTFAGAGQWLTEFDATINAPQEITADWSFDYASADTPYRETIRRTEPVYIFGIPGGLFIVGSVLVVILLLPLVLIVGYSRRKRVARVSP